MRKIRAEIVDITGLSDTHRRLLTLGWWEGDHFTPNPKAWSEPKDSRGEWGWGLVSDGSLEFGKDGHYRVLHAWEAIGEAVGRGIEARPLTDEEWDEYDLQQGPPDWAYT